MHFVWREGERERKRGRERGRGRGRGRGKETYMYLWSGGGRNISGGVTRFKGGARVSGVLHRVRAGRDGGRGAGRSDGVNGEGD